MKDRNINRWLTVICILIAVVGFNLWPFFGKGFFYKALALHFIFTYVTAYRLARQLTPVSVFCIKGMLVGVALAFSNLLDEAFFDPTKIQVNEYITGYVVLMVICLRSKVWNK